MFQQHYVAGLLGAYELQQFVATSQQVALVGDVDPCQACI